MAQMLIDEDCIISGVNRLDESALSIAEVIMMTI